LAIDYQKGDGVAYIMLNNPAKANMLDKKTSDEISDAWIDLGKTAAKRLDDAYRSGGFKREGYSSARNAWHTYDAFP